MSVGYGRAPVLVLASSTSLGHSGYILWEFQYVFYLFYEPIEARKRIIEGRASVPALVSIGGAAELVEERGVEEPVSRLGRLVFQAHRRL